jgi:superfamily II DNA/RNA helicase
MKTIQQFKQGNFHLLVATDVAARGIHIDNLSLVINYDVPLEKDSYVHRIGRTGRAGNCGRALSLVTSEDIMSLYAIEEHIGTMIPEGELPTAEMYKNQKAEADKWAKANAVPVRTYNSDVESFSKRPSKTYSGPNSKRPQSNQYPKKPKQQYNKHTNKTGENFSYNKTANKTANRTGSTYANHRQQRPAPNYRQHKSAQTNAKSVQNPLHNAAVNTINKNPEAQKTENVKTKKTFIQRVLQKIFSK